MFARVIAFQLNREIYYSIPLNNSKHKVILLELGLGFD